VTQKKMNPAAGDTASGARDASQAAARTDHTTGVRADKARLTVCLPPVPDPIIVNGKAAQTLALLIQRGARGVTSDEAQSLGWARRTSEYVRKLRRAGIPILTTRETSDEARIGRYTLGGAVVVVGPEVSMTAPRHVPALANAICEAKKAALSLGRLPHPDPKTE
jgi:hypothetical protein